MSAGRKYRRGLNGGGGRSNVNFAQLPRETREILNMRGMKALDSIPEEMRSLVVETAEKTNVSVMDSLLAFLESVGSVLKGKFAMQVGEKIVSFENEDYSFMTPFKDDFKRAREYYGSTIENARKEREEPEEGNDGTRTS